VERSETVRHLLEDHGFAGHLRFDGFPGDPRSRPWNAWEIWEYHEQLHRGRPHA